MPRRARRRARANPVPHVSVACTQMAVRERAPTTHSALRMQRWRALRGAADGARGREIAAARNASGPDDDDQCGRRCRRRASTPHRRLSVPHALLDISDEYLRARIRGTRIATTLTALEAATFSIACAREPLLCCRHERTVELRRRTTTGPDEGTPRHSEEPQTAYATSVGGVLVGSSPSLLESERPAVNRTFTAAVARRPAKLADVGAIRGTSAL